MTTDYADRVFQPVTVDRLAHARHRWQHPTYPFGSRNRCGCLGWAETVADMLDFLEEDERRAEDSSPLGHGTPVPEEATLPSGDARVAAL